MEETSFADSALPTRSFTGTEKAVESERSFYKLQGSLLLEDVTPVIKGPLLVQGHAVAAFGAFLHEEDQRNHAGAAY
jgi:hypothetical protein